MMRREIIPDYKDKIDTPEEMVLVLSTIRDHLLKHYCIYYGWSSEETYTLLDMVLKLNKEIRHFEWLVIEKRRNSGRN